MIKKTLIVIILSTLSSLITLFAITHIPEWSDKLSLVFTIGFLVLAFGIINVLLITRHKKR